MLNKLMGDDMTIGDHYEGFEDARKMSDMMQDHEDFQAVIKRVGEAFYQEAYKRRPCRRTLRYIGHSGWDEPERSIKHRHFVEGQIYHSIDFNGATYSIEGYHDGKALIGCAYFEWIREMT